MVPAPISGDLELPIMSDSGDPTSSSGLSRSHASIGYTYSQTKHSYTYFFLKKKKRHISQHSVVGESHPSTLSDKVLIELITKRYLQPGETKQGSKMGKISEQKSFKDRCGEQPVSETDTFISQCTLGFLRVFKSRANFVGFNSLLIPNGNCSHWKTQVLLFPS